MLDSYDIVDGIPSSDMPCVNCGKHDCHCNDIELPEDEAMALFKFLKEMEESRW